MTNRLTFSMSILANYAERSNPTPHIHTCCSQFQVQTIALKMSDDSSRQHLLSLPHSSTREAVFDLSLLWLVLSYLQYSLQFASEDTIRIGILFSGSLRLI